MRKLLIFLAITSNQSWVQCFLIKFTNETERYRRSSENMEKILFGSYNDYIESKSSGKAFCFLTKLAISSAQ